MPLNKKIKCCDHGRPLWEECGVCDMLDDTLPRIMGDDAAFTAFMVELGMEDLPL